MDELELFTKALALEDPWQVTDVKLIPVDTAWKMELHISIDFIRGSKFSCPVDECGMMCDVHDTVDKTWRHLNFFQYRTYIHARVPRVSCEIHGVKMAAVPWARPGSGFTLLFESWVVTLARFLPVSRIAAMIDEHDTRLWRFIRYYVDEARAIADYSDVTAFGVDETSKKGHNYITVFVDHKTHKVIFVTDGKDKSTIGHFKHDFMAHGGNPDKVEIVTCDMSLGFKSGLTEHFKNHTTIIDKFHVVKHCNEAVDKTRKAELKETDVLRKTKYIWLHNEENLSDRQMAKKESLAKMNLKTGRAYAMKCELQDIYQTETHPNEAKIRLEDLCSWMMHSRLEHMKSFSRLVRGHWDDIMNYFYYHYTNAVLEGINSVIQQIKTRARGFRNPEYFKTMIYLVCGGLDLDEVFVAG